MNPRHLTRISLLAASKRLGGVVVSKRRGIRHLFLLKITERAAAQGAVYGAAGNLRTTRIYYASNAGLAASGKLKTLQKPNGRQASYAYVINENTPGVFMVATVTNGTVDSPAGIANKTLRHVVTKNSQGRTISDATQVYTGSDYSPLNTYTNAYNAEGVLIQRSKDGRVIYNATYSGGRLTSTTDEAGIVRTFTYDALERIATETKLGTENQPDIITTYNRTLGGLDCGCDANLETTISAGGLSLTSSVKKDQLGRILEQTDQSGLVTTYAYTNGGKTTTILKPSTATEIRETFIDGQTKSVTGTGVIAQYASYGINPDGAQWIKANLISETGTRWGKNTSDFLGRNILTEAPGFAGAIISNATVYNALGQISTQTKTTTPGSVDVPSATGTQTITYAYDPLGNITSTSTQTTDATGQTTSPITNLTEQLYSQENNAWFSVSKQQLQYTENSQQQTITTSLAKQQLNGFSNETTAHLENYAVPFDAAGNSINKTTQSTTINRNTKTHITTTTSPTSTQSAIQTTINGFLVSSISSTHGGTTLYQYDALGRQTGQKQPRHENYSTTTYNGKGQVVTTANAAGNTTTYVYYDNGVPGAGQLRQQINTLGHSTFHEYDLQRREVYTWGPATYPIVQGYDAYGQRNLLRTFRDTSADFSSAIFPIGSPGDTTTWIYDDATGVLLQKLYADGKGPSYAYYADGLLKARTWARKDANNNPLTTTYTYTSQGQLSFIDYSDTTPDVTYTYNALGQQTTITDGTGTRNFTYDLAIQVLTQEIYTGTLNATLTRAYDAYTRPTGYALIETTEATNTQPAINTVRTAATYTYDTQGNFLQVQGDTIPSQLTASLVGANTTNLTPSTFTYNRVVNSDLVSTVVGPVHTVTNTYEINRDVITTKQNRVITGPNTNSIISQYDYTVNAIGQRTTRTQSGSAFDGIGYAPGTQLPTSMTGTPGSGTSTDVFNYNTRGEVINSTNNIQSALARSYSYDPIGNRLNATEGDINTPATHPSTKTYTSNSLNQYTQINTTAPTPPTTAQPTYDDDGNMLTDGTGKSYIWDCENRLVQVNLQDDRIVRNYYDLDFRRIKREKIDSLKTQTSIFVYDDWNKISENLVTESSNDSEPEMLYYMWGPGLYGRLKEIGGSGGLLSLKLSRENVDLKRRYYTYDTNGNISDLIDLNGIICAHYEFDLSGRTVRQFKDIEEANTFEFSTCSWDADISLSYFGYRFYAPQDNRWINRDPLGEWAFEAMYWKMLYKTRYLIVNKDIFHLYRFVKNSPVNSVDFLGLATLFMPSNVMPQAPFDGNCWRWACGDPAKPGEKPRVHPAPPRVDPGRPPLLPRIYFTCEDIMKGAKEKGAKSPNKDGSCPCDHYKIRGVIQEKNCKQLDLEVVCDYHWYREDTGGSWSEKPGLTPPVYDTDPDDRSKYDKDCGFLCVPDGGIDADAPPSAK